MRLELSRPTAARVGRRTGRAGDRTSRGHARPRGPGVLRAVAGERLIAQGACLRDLHVVHLALVRKTENACPEIDAPLTLSGRERHLRRGDQPGRALPLRDRHRRRAGLRLEGRRRRRAPVGWSVRRPSRNGRRAGGELRGRALGGARRSPQRLTLTSLKVSRGIRRTPRTCVARPGPTYPSSSVSRSCRVTPLRPDLRVSTPCDPGEQRQRRRVSLAASSGARPRFAPVTALLIRCRLSCSSAVAARERMLAERSRPRLLVGAWRLH
jgi:hypothetical protein